MRWVTALAALMLPLPALAADPVPVAEARVALVAIADSVADVILDEAGRAKGDYDWRAGKWSEYEAAWHTGQSIEALVAAYRVTGEARFLSRAREAGNWWIALEYRDGPLNGLVNAAHADRLGRLINFTTIGDGTPGLFSLSRATGDPKYADTATRAIVWLAQNMAVPGEPGLYYNILDPRTGEIWRDRSPHHDVAKASLNQVARPNIEGSPFLDACRHARLDWLCNRHFALARSTAARQDESGFWMAFEPNNPDTGAVHPRFNTWNAEALLKTWRETKEQPLFDAALATARANVRLMRRDGSFDYVQSLTDEGGNGSPTGSATAFAGLLWLDLRGAGVTEFDAQIHAAARWIIANRFAGDHPDPNLRGLVIELRQKRSPGGEGRTVLQRDLGSIFAARFLAAYLEQFGDQ